MIQAWMQFGHCFDCQIEFENKLIIKENMKIGEKKLYKIKYQN